jgi:hypothetical protein
MRDTTRRSRENRTLTVDFQNEATYFPHSPGLSGRPMSLHW